MKEKIEKKVIQEKQDPQEIKFKIESGRMVFDMGDREYFLEEEQANFLFGRNIGIKFEQLKADEKEDFSDLNTSDFIAKFQAAYEFYGNLQGAAKYLKADEKRLMGWMADNDSKKLNDKLTIYDGKFEYDESYKKYRLELFGEEKQMEQGPYNPDLRTINKIADLVIKKHGPREIAKKMKVDYGSFLPWFTSKESHDRIQLIMRNK